MTEEEAKRKWIEAWRFAGPELEKIRLREVRTEDNLQSIEALSGCFNQGLRNHVPPPTSGLVEMQRYFAKLRR